MAEQDLKNQFDNITLMKLFEIELDGEYALYDLHCNNEFLWCVGYCGALKVDLDPVFSLDEHLQELYDACYNDAVNAQQQNLL